jgi:protocatechuate 3,4-dioxygenase beta subunit
MKALKIKLPVSLIALVFSFSCCLTVFGQSSATLQGTVSDQKGAVMPKAKVMVHNQATGLERTTETDNEGSYQVAALPVGVYRVEVRRPDFRLKL